MRCCFSSVLDADLRFALDDPPPDDVIDRPPDDIIGRCLVYVHRVVDAQGEREKKARDAIDDRGSLIINQ